MCHVNGCKSLLITKNTAFYRKLYSGWNVFKSYITNTHTNTTKIVCSEYEMQMQHLTSASWANKDVWKCVVLLWFLFYFFVNGVIFPSLKKGFSVSFFSSWLKAGNNHFFFKQIMHEKLPTEVMETVKEVRNNNKKRYFIWWPHFW